MQLYKYILQRFDYLIFDSYKIKSTYLGLYRILFCVFTFLFYGIPNYTWINNSPDYLFSPPHISIATFFNGFPSAYFFTVSNIIIVILYIMLFFGWKTKYTSLLLFFTLLICQSFSFSFGKIDHNIVWLVIPLIMAFSGWGNAYSVDAFLNQKSEENSWAITLMALILGFAMFTASVPKILSGWLDLDSQATLSHLIYNNLFWDRKALLLNEVLQIKSKLFWETFDYLTVIFEFGFLFAILKPQLFRFFVLAAVLFHISIFLTFDIIFTVNLLTYLLFINWATLDSLLKSPSFDKIVNKVFVPRNLALSIGLILSYALVSVTIQKSFEIPSALELTLDLLRLETYLRYVKTFILFAVSLAIAFVCIKMFLQQRINEKRLQVTNSSLLKNETA